MECALDDNLTLPRLRCLKKLCLWSSPGGVMEVQEVSSF